MAHFKTVNIDGVGPALFEYSKRAKHISISVRPFYGVRVAVPQRSSFNMAREFVNAKIDWIKTQLKKTHKFEREFKSNPVIAEAIDKEKAKDKLTLRLKQLAEKNGFMYNRVFFRNQKTRWGSCSGNNNISLNIKLVKLPNELIDYVILHELVHTRRKDHSKAFWLEMDKLLGNGKKMAERLRKYRIGLI